MKLTFMSREYLQEATHSDKILSEQPISPGFTAGILQKLTSYGFHGGDFRLWPHNIIIWKFIVFCKRCRVSKSVHF